MNTHYSIKIKAFAVCFGFFSLMLGSCREDKTIRPDLIPDIDNINTFGLNADSMDAHLQVRMFDSLYSGDAALPIVGAGILNGDPFYGDLDAGFFMQVSVPSAGFAFPDDMVAIDSSRIVLPYSTFCYGDTTAPVALNVYEVDDPTFKVDTTLKKYYSFSNVNYDPAVIGSVSKVLKDLSSERIGYSNGDTFTNQLVINLSSTFTSRFNSMTEADGKNNSNFVNFLNGFYIAPDPAADVNHKKGVHYFLISPSNATSFYQKGRLEVYYHKADGKAYVAVFPYTTTYSSFFTKIKRNYTGFPAEGYAVTGKPVDSVLIQGGPGFQTDIVLNDISKIIPNSFIHAARIEINVKKSGLDPKFKHPPLLMLNGVNDDGTVYNIADYQVTGTTDLSERLSLAQKFVGGNPVDKLIAGEEYVSYTLNIPREIQRARMDGKNKLRLRLFPYYSYAGAYRLIAYGFNSSGDEKMKINIVYTKP